MTFTELPDLASRELGGAVLLANDEFFAEKENLVKAGPAVFDTESFGHKGKIYDGWETRRRREPGYDWAIVRLGAPGIISGVIVDTAFFKGNFPSEASIEAASVPGHPSAQALLGDDVEWVEIVSRSALEGHTENSFEVSSTGRFTHVRLNIFPDGGVARLRVHGEVVLDPRLIDGVSLDLAGLGNGGHVVDCSNRFYSSPNNLLRSDEARHMGEGWETARRRDGGNEHVTVQLTEMATIAQIELDTRYFKGNAPGECAISGSADGQNWQELLPRTDLQPDTRHRFIVHSDAEVKTVRVDVYPDGGFARLRLLGTLTASGRAASGLRWFNALPATEASAALTSAGVGSEQAQKLVAARPVVDAQALGEVESAARVLLLGPDS